MDSTDKHLRSILVNGQPILIPDQQGWQTLWSEPSIDGQSLSVLDLIRKDYDFATQHPELVIGFRKPGKASVSWLYCVLLFLQNNFQRVHLERVTCQNCAWQGIIANPKVVDLYIDVPNWQEALILADKYPQVFCPRCKSKLPRYAIWTEVVFPHH